MQFYTHLSPEERTQISLLRAQGLSVRKISTHLGRAQSTISRELRRNSNKDGSYVSTTAERRYMARRKRPSLMERWPKLANFVHHQLHAGWTPEIIAGWLKAGNEALRPISHETIYRWIYKLAGAGIKLWKLLPRHRAKRRPNKARRPRSLIPERRSIHDRPDYVHKRQEPGHWEADYLICKNNRPLLVIQERKSRFIMAVRLKSRSAQETLEAILDAFQNLSAKLKASITFDNDTGFAKHNSLAKALGIDTWFCDAYASWQKGGVENANGRLRRDIPRSTDLDAMTEIDFNNAILDYNLTPRKCLGFKTPLQAILNELGMTANITFS